MLTATIVLGCIFGLYSLLKSKAKYTVLNLKRVGLAAAHTHIITGCSDAQLAAIAVKTMLGAADGADLVQLIGKLPDITEQEQLARQSDIRQLLANISMSLKDQIRCKSELRGTGSRWSVAVEKADFKVASDILLRVLP